MASGVLMPAILMVMAISGLFMMIRGGAEAVGQRHAGDRTVAQLRILRSPGGELIEGAGIEVEGAQLDTAGCADHRIPAARSGLVLGFEPLSMAINLVSAAGRHLDASHQCEAGMLTARNIVSRKDAKVADARGIAAFDDVIHRMSAVMRVMPFLHVITVDVRQLGREGQLVGQTVAKSGGRVDVEIGVVGVNVVPGQSCQLFI